MELELVREAIRQNKVIWRAHALERMVARGVSTDDVRRALLHGEVVEDYPDDRPYPSVLVMSRAEGRLLHVVVAHDSQSGYALVITAYEPDPRRFDPTTAKRRKDA
jgi:hypothetical protein